MQLLSFLSEIPTVRLIVVRIQYKFAYFSIDNQVENF